MAFTEAEGKAIFKIIKSALEECCPPMVVSKSSAKAFEIMGNKEVPYGYKKELVPGMYFSSVVIRPSMVSFYFFPMYMNADAFKKTAPVLFRTLKGKTCFNIKKEEDVVKKELTTLLQKGIDVWNKLGYMK